MNYYTLESLKEINHYSSYRFDLTEQEVAQANEFLDALAISRNNEIPAVGDVVIYTEKDGAFYKSALIESIQDNEHNICLGGSVPFASPAKDGQRILLSASGGPWTTVNLTDRSNGSTLVKVGSKKQKFKEFSRTHGACASGSFYFEGEVNVWRYFEKSNLDFSEEFFDRWYISYNPDAKTDDYQYNVHGPNEKAFKTKEECDAWVKTIRGISSKGHWENQMIVWSYKQKSVRVSSEEYANIDGIVDTMLSNGLRECKRVYDNENCIVYTYFLGFGNPDYVNVSFPNLNIPYRAAYIELFGQ